MRSPGRRNRTARPETRSASTTAVRPFETDAAKPTGSMPAGRSSDESVRPSPRTASPGIDNDSTEKGSRRAGFRLSSPAAPSARARAASRPAPSTTRARREAPSARRTAPRARASRRSAWSNPTNLPADACSERQAGDTARQRRRQADQRGGVERHRPAVARLPERSARAARGQLVEVARRRPARSRRRGPAPRARPTATDSDGPGTRRAGSGSEDAAGRRFDSSSRNATPAAAEPLDQFPVRQSISGRTIGPAASRHAAEAQRARASEQVQQHGLGLVVARVADGHVSGAGPRPRPVEELVAKAASGVLERRAPPPAPRPARHRVRTRTASRDRSASSRQNRSSSSDGRAPEHVVEVRQARPVRSRAAARHVAQQADERGGVCTARRGHEHARARRKQAISVDRPADSLGEDRTSRASTLRARGESGAGAGT